MAKKEKSRSQGGISEENKKHMIRLGFKKFSGVKSFTTLSLNPAFAR